MGVKGKNYKKVLFSSTKKRISVNLWDLNSNSKPAKKGKKASPSSVDYKNNRNTGKGK